MPTTCYSDELPIHEPILPAWIVSLVFHAAVLVLLGLFFRGVPRGAGEEPVRTAGIVIQHSSARGDWFEGEADQPAESIRDPDRGQYDPIAALPPEDLMATAANALSSLPAIGLGGLESGGVGNASGMTSGGGRGGAISGGKARVRVFGTEGVGNKFVYVFDRSVSMEGTRLQAAKRELIQSLESLESTHQFQVIFFNHEVRIWDLTGGQQRIAFGTDRNKEQAARWIMGISADGGTDRVGALNQAIRLRPDIIFFLTDDDTPMSETDLYQIRRRNRSGTAIHAIEFGNGPPHGRHNFLVQLAQQSGGQYAYIDTRTLGR
ncbi:MAG: VWA domain-containing protein [Pirellulales bacterium]|nr:VWA domain-containing protein [Pirellulales bacterium]